MTKHNKYILTLLIKAGSVYMTKYDLYTLSVGKCWGDGITMGKMIGGELL